MADTTNAGFTGVVWESRPTEKLAADLGTGAGPAPLAEAGLAWAKLGEEVAAIGIEYTKVLASLGVHWESSTFNAAFEKLTQLAPWFADAAMKLGETAVKAETQSIANTVALATMPSLPEVALTKEMTELLAQAGIMLGAPILASGTETETVKHEQAQRAARVMQNYEQATKPVASEWAFGAPPKIVSGAALEAERAAAAANRTKATNVSRTGHSGGMPLGVGGIGAVPREKSKYAATTPASVTATPVLPPPIPTDVMRNSSGMMPMAPMMGAAAAGAGRSDTVARSAGVQGATVTGGEGDKSSVRLPAGWLSTDDDGPASWTQVTQRIDEAERAPVPGEGVLNLGPVAPSVIGAPDGEGRD